MPYCWIEADHAAADAPLTRLVLWPHQSLTGRGFVAFISATAAMLALPLLALLGSPVTWVLLVFFLAALAGVWFAIMKNREHQSLHEVLAIWPGRIRLDHIEPALRPLAWEANPYWVSVHLHAKGGLVENYLTLRGSEREVELGTFLTPDEREALYCELTEVLERLR